MNAKNNNSDKGGLKGWHNEFLDLCRSSGLFILNEKLDTKLFRMPHEVHISSPFSLFLCRLCKIVYRALLEMLLDPKFCVDARDQKGRKGCVGAPTFHLTAHTTYKSSLLKYCPSHNHVMSLASQVAQMAYSDRPRFISEYCFTLHNHRWLHK